MALVPTGKLKIMEAQSLQTDHNQSANLFDGMENLNIPEDRNSVQQQPIEEDIQLDNNEEQISPTNNEQQNISQTNNQEIANQNNDTEISDLQSFIYKTLEGLGVEKRQLLNLSKQIYSEETDLDSGTLRGHYMIPSHTIKGAINNKKAQEIAKQIGRKFNLSQKLKFLPISVQGKTSGVGNWRVDFTSAPKKEAPEEHGNSFDALYSENDKKVAKTIGEIIKDRKNELYNTLRKIANKE